MVVLRCASLRRCRIGAIAPLCAVKYEVLSSNIANRRVRYRNLRVCPSRIVPRRRCVIVDSRPVLGVGHGIPTGVIIICEVLSLVARLYQLILNLLMETVNSRIIAVNRCCPKMIRLLVSSSILVQYLIWGFVVIGAHHTSVTILICHHLLLGLSLHIIRLRGRASVGVRSSHDVRIKLPLRVRACRHSSSPTYLWRRRVCTHRHLYAARVEIRGSLVHEVLSHCNGSPASRAHQGLLIVNRLLP